MSHKYEQNYGRVARLYPTASDGGRVFFKLQGGQTAMNPKAGYYFLSKRHENYQAMVDLLYMAAKHGYQIKVSTKPALVGDFAEAVYFVVDF